jgi:hypothetical protein
LSVKIEEYLKSLPQEIILGEDVQLPENSFRDIFEFSELNENDVFYHLGCGDGRGVGIASKEFNVKKSIGIDIDKNKIEKAKNQISNCDFVCQDITNSDFEDATVILFWFTEEDIIQKMMKKFENLKQGCKVITIWGPLPGCLPEKVDFPYIINQIPFKQAKDLQEQLLAVFGVKCIDFVTAWENAERYTKAIGPPEAGNDRFLTIMQSLVIWINAKNLGVACGDEMPESIKTYIGILRTYFNIEVEHLLKK